MTLASDQEREAAVLRLRAAHLEGRLDADELEARIAAAMDARTTQDLAAATEELPAEAADAEPTRGVPRLPGWRHFTERKVLQATLAVVRAQLLEGVVPPLERYGYRVTEEGPQVVLLHGELGATLSIRLRALRDGRTLVVVHGTGPLRVRRAFAGLRD